MGLTRASPFHSDSYPFKASHRPLFCQMMMMPTKNSPDPPNPLESHQTCFEAFWKSQCPSVKGRTLKMNQTQNTSTAVVEWLAPETFGKILTLFLTGLRIFLWAKYYGMSLLLFAMVGQSQLIDYNDELNFLEAKFKQVVCPSSELNSHIKAYGRHRPASTPD